MLVSKSTKWNNAKSVLDYAHVEKNAQTVSIYSISRIQVCIIRTKQNAITYDCMLVA